MDYNYDGLGRRRNAWEGYPNGAPTWYCWEGWQELGTYAHGAADWDIGDIERYYIPGLGEVAEDEPGGQNAEWRPVARLAIGNSGVSQVEVTGVHSQELPGKLNIA
ncbi:MAG: hypothetical protein IT368_13500 [Candidatus Hydrogenedentes bacterium]|nr:hypothetical protein [Candidatus Hydrogenedentota bacterium]